MNLKDLKEISALVEAKYEVRRQAFQTIVAKENDLRSELRRIDIQAQTARQSVVPSMQSIGADVIWKRWVGRAKASLNTKLALVLAEKEQHIRQVRQAYGKVIAAERLIEDLSDRDRKALNDLALGEAIESQIFSQRQSLDTFNTEVLADVRVKR
ncbi:MAG: hypothetical protein R8G34_11670 [Paracoccaceae bacterium]|nr:hypothetical protein [Paracoccaceae bacterium]